MFLVAMGLEFTGLFVGTTLTCPLVEESILTKPMVMKDTALANDADNPDSAASSQVYPDLTPFLLKLDIHL